jgi:hypothetical protein
LPWLLEPLIVVVHSPPVLAPAAPLRDWQPDLPEGDVRSLSLHWTGDDYERVFPSYHFCITGFHDTWVHHTHDLRANMRDVRLEADAPYAAHTQGRNAWSLGLAVAAMRDATPSGFGPYPITEAQLDALCSVAARLAAFYAIPIAAIRTHAESALDDGYFGAGGDETRWDIARFAPSPRPLEPADAVGAGDDLRRRIAALVARGAERTG